MEIIVMGTLYLLMFTFATARPTDIEGELEELREPQCLSKELLVELPIVQETFHKLSTTHAYVRRCIGVNDEKKACVPKNLELNMEHWMVVKDTGSDKNEFIRVSWISHQECGYQQRTCPIDEARICHAQSTTHYYDELNCKCTCIVQVDQKETCLARTINYVQVDSENRINHLENEIDLVTKELSAMKSKLHYLENAMVPKNSDETQIEILKN